MGQDNKTIRLNKAAKELNVGVSTLVEFLHKKGINVELNPNEKIEPEHYELLRKEFSKDSILKKEADKKSEEYKEQRKALHDEKKEEKHQAEQQTIEIKTEKKEIKIVGKIDLNPEKKETVVVSTEKPVAKEESSSKPVQVVQPEPEPIKESTPVQVAEQAAPKDIKPSDSADVTVDVKKGSDIKVLGHIDLDTKTRRPDNKNISNNNRPQQKDNGNNRRDNNINNNLQKNEQPKTVIVNPPAEEPKKDSSNDNNTNAEPEIYHRPRTVLAGPTVIGKIELPVERRGSSQNKNAANNAANNAAIKKKKRRRIGKDPVVVSGNHGNNNPQNNPANGNNNNANNGNNNNNNNNNAQGQQRRPNNGEQNHNRGNNNTQNNNNRNNRPGGRPNNNNNAPSNGNNNGNGPKRFVRNNFHPGNNNPVSADKKDVSEEDVSKQVRDTLARLTQKTKSKTSKHRREKRDEYRNKMEEEIAQEERESKILKVTEFISANELATLMGIHVNQIIATCMDLGTSVSINQRLDAEVINILASEFGFDVQFISAETRDAAEEEVDSPEDLSPRPPIVTVMGHVDHGKTSLLDYIRKTNVIAGEAGGITQHIGAYNVKVEGGKNITFLDTPGHEAFTAMRARGAKITDIAVIVIAADDDIMPQTKEAISHAQAAGVPIIFAINKIDKPGANPEKIKEELANMNLLIEEWGGKYGSVDISAKKGLNVDKLLERILLEAEMLDLKANYSKSATGTIIESSLDKGRGYVATILVDGGILKAGDIMWAGGHYGKIKAMFNERNKKIQQVGPGEPALILGLDGAPEAGDKFKVMESEKDAREKAVQRQQIQREIGVRTQTRITLTELARRKALGDFHELNIIVKGDVQGSLEALEDSLIKLSTEEIQINVILKSVGQISEGDVMLASASDAIIIGFQVRPSLGAKKLADKDGIDIRLYSIIYDAIGDIKDAMEGMLSPEIKEEIVGTAEITQVFKITKVGNIAGCMVKDGKIVRANKCRIIRDGIVVYTGELGSLKRFKDDVKEVGKGFECGLNIEKYNDIKVGDIVESYEEKEVKKTL